MAAVAAACEAECGVGGKRRNHNWDDIFFFRYKNKSPALMMACMGVHRTLKVRCL